MHSTGNLPSNGEIDVPIIYADYYYLEALLRFKKIEEATSAGPVVSAAIAGGNKGVIFRACLVSGQGRFRVAIVEQEKFPLTPRVYDIRGCRISAGTIRY